jgi:hypothetical protein
VAVCCDHTDDSQVEAVFHRIDAEQGRLDVRHGGCSADIDGKHPRPLTLDEV